MFLGTFLVAGIYFFKKKIRKWAKIGLIAPKNYAFKISKEAKNVFRAILKEVRQTCTEIMTW